jgi:hypothetical protein
MLQPFRHSLAIALVCLVTQASVSSAATFEITYDDLANQAIGDVVGTGTFSYDGPATVGSFALSSLTGVTFDAIVFGEQFTTADLATNFNVSGISVFDTGGGVLGLVFTGFGGAYDDGALDLERTSDGWGLTHEPTEAIGVRTGCCGGDGTVNRYFLGDEIGPFQGGDYVAVLPEPGALGPAAIGLLALAASRRSRRT